MLFPLVILALVATCYSQILLDPEACGSSAPRVIDIPPSGNLTSPNYPSNYPNNAACYWHIRSSDTTQSVAIAFLDFATESGYDSLRVYDGDSTSAPLIGTYSGTGTPEPVAASGSNMLLHFSTDGSVVNRGFQIVFDTAQLGCGALQPATIEDLSGTVTSASWPNMYPTEQQCSWQIIAPNNYVVTADFSHFDTHTADILLIYDNLEPTGTILATLAGALTVPFTVQSTGYTMYLEFTTQDTVTQHVGWRMTFSSHFDDPACGPGAPSLRLDASGEFYSRNFPYFYPQNENCQWLIYSNNSIFEISLNITHLDTLQNIDSVRVYDGETTDAPLLVAASGSVPPPTIQSTNNSLLVVFTSINQLSQNTGFRVMYEAKEGCKDRDVECNTWATDGWCTRCPSTMNARCPETCGTCSLEINADEAETCEVPDEVESKVQVKKNPEPFDDIACNNLLRPRYLEAEWGEFFSRDWPNNYRNNENCVWRIESPAGNLIQIDFTHFDTEECTDTLSVFEGASQDPANLIGSFCGNTVPDTVMSPSNVVTVVFTSDASNTFNGWRAVYNRVVDTPACNANRPLELDASMSGSFTSRNWPIYYPGDDHCEWLIQTSGAETVRLNFTAFDTRDCTDQVKVFDGNSTDGDLLLNACGTTIPDPVMSTQSNMYVQFQSTGSGVNKAEGFRAIFEPIIECTNRDPDCGTWAGTGWCARCPTYMNSQCYQACGNC